MSTETATTAGDFRQQTPEEIEAVMAVLRREGLFTDTHRIAYLGLLDPPRGAQRVEVSHDRRFRVFILDSTGGTPRDAVVSAARGELLSNRELDSSVDGEFPVMEEEFEVVEAILAEDPQWLEAIAKRDIPIDEVRVAPLSAGVFEYDDEVGHRILRGLAFHQQHETDSAWAHPIDGLVAYVDVTAKKVTQVLDFGPVPVPAEHGNYTDPEMVGEVRTSQKPIEITQPEGPSFTVADGNHVEWERWSLDVGFDMREGLVLQNIAFDDPHTGRRRTILDRAAIAEMVVPYGDPSPVRSWQNYFDTGEYLVGQWANSLELGCDCLGDITYLSPWVVNNAGEPRQIKNGICMHEEDWSILSKHTDLWSGVAYTRRNRRLVISFFTTVGNYDYGFYWYLYLDGNIEFEAKATGVVFTSAVPDGPTDYASEMAPGLGAPFHQHLFGARLDFALDGGACRVVEEDGVRLPISEENPRGNAFTRKHTVLATEQQAIRETDQSVGRTWIVESTESTNRLGRPVGYKLHPEGLPTLLAAEGSSIHKRATFASKALWVSQYHEDERYPTGDFPNQHAGGAGLPEWTAADRSVDGEDLVVWHSFGLTHFPRVEDWPIMPVDVTGFKLRPEGFFDRSPVLDVPAPRKGHCSTDAGGGVDTAKDGNEGCCSA
ncbi:primary-amine oxidase [Micrococcus lylae]|uniref:Amine oxidase n=1 Tax=Micrococcus lylae TaxID=1273 RepID=A0ABY2JYK2_9MICC|nr:primary-amine oxidase [Micrococcus lylae]MCT2006427.1 primary-amine oxidase [Micrococcus lylae]MCT2071073.1 primary-amine oxidase [Micrococcus lylae]TFH97862.1 primary-amine oxidase [Micrococcus lylae]